MKGKIKYDIKRRANLKAICPLALQFVLKYKHANLLNAMESDYSHYLGRILVYNFNNYVFLELGSKSKLIG